MKVNIYFIHILVVLTFLGISGIYYYTENIKLETHQKDIFSSYTKKNMSSLRENIIKKNNLLDAQIGFFRSSNYVDENELREFNSSLGLIEKGYQSCWISADERELYIVNETLKPLCSDLNLLDRSDVILDEHEASWVLLSKFTSSHEETQKGVLFFFFPIAELAQSEQWSPDLYYDSIMANDRVSNKLINLYRTNGASTESSSQAYYEEIYSLGAFVFYYNSQIKTRAWSEGEKFKALIISLLIFLTGTLLALWINNLIFKNSEIKEIVKIKTDELRQANIRLEAVNEELTQYAYRTSHDLKAPLISSRRLINFVFSDIRSGNLAEAEKNSERASRLLSQLEGLTNDLLSLVRADFDIEESENLNISLIIKEIEEKLLTIVDDYSCRIIDETEVLAPHLPKLRVAQVLENLISNGIKYSNKEDGGSYVKVKSCQDGSSLLIIVEDNGVGIPADSQSEIYSKFKRFHPELSFGSGLGMSIVKKHINALGGEISLTSSNSGTRFKLILPNAFGEIL